MMSAHGPQAHDGRWGTPRGMAITPPTKKTLASVIGSVGAAAMLFVIIPREESGRVVEATVQADQSITVRHVSGKQYLNAYLDIVGVATACDGITRIDGARIKLGDKFTEARCAALLEEELIAHAEPVIQCIPELYGRQYQVVGTVDLAFNIGPKGVCTSSLVRLFRAKNWKAGCDWLIQFRKAGGVVSRGLENRRRRLMEVCYTGIVVGKTPANLDARVKGIK